MTGADVPAAVREAIPPQAITAAAKLHEGTGQPMTGIEHPADGTFSPPLSSEHRWELCNGTLLVEPYITGNVGERRIRLTDRLAGESLTLRWEQWEDLKEAVEAAAAPHLAAAERDDGVSLIAAERRRQVEAEGWTAQHDDHHTAGEMARAAACYALAASAPIWATRLAGSDDMRGAWPLQWEFKQADPLRMLTKAGALIAAEIDRLLREQQP